MLCAALTSGLVLTGCTPAEEPGLLGLLRGRPEVAQVGSVELPHASRGWQSTGVTVREGQGVTLFGFGEQVGARAWVRLGDADIVNLGEETYSFDAWADGEIEVLSLPAGVRWERCDGELPASLGEAEETSPGHEVVAVAWSSDPASSLASLPEDPDVARALMQLEATRPLPEGFREVCYLPRSTTVFEAWHEGDRRGVWGNASSNAGIIKKAVDLPLDESTTISFDWRYDALHSLAAETDPLHHDYSSIAVEFDNGQDITWMRSPHLEAITSFRCPLDWWDQRETHIVLQGGRDDVGIWQSHTRPVLEDYMMSVGGEPPQRIVGVWFISVGVFDGTTADTKYSDVVLRTGERRVEIF